jgi:hypothetical protein
MIANESDLRHFLSMVLASHGTRESRKHDCCPVIGIIVLIIQQHKTFGMFSNHIKQEACIILENTDHVLQILRMQHVHYGVHAGILELLWEAGRAV